MSSNVELVRIILSFMVLINPFAALGLFLELTKGYSVKNKQKMAFIGSATVFFTMAFFTFCGDFLLKILGISVGSFQTAGGILIFLIALNMINGDGNPVKPDYHNIDIELVQEILPSPGSAVVPLAIPMMIGPGGISSVIIYSSKVTTMGQNLVVLLASLLIAMICYVSLMTANKVSVIIGETGINIFNRIMGILLAAVAVEVMVSGIKNLFPQLA